MAHCGHGAATGPGKWGAGERNPSASSTSLLRRFHIRLAEPGSAATAIGAPFLPVPNTFWRKSGTARSGRGDEMIVVNLAWHFLVNQSSNSDWAGPRLDSFCG